MSHAEKDAKDYIGYEYKEIVVNAELASLYLDCYADFGWKADDNIPITGGTRQMTLKLKRDRKILNKMELTRLQRNFESCINEIEKLEKSKTLAGTVYALSLGAAGTAFMAGSVFAITAQPPHIFLSILLAAPGFAGWFFPYFLYHKITGRHTEKVKPLIEEKYEEIYGICEKGNKLLN